MPPRTGELPKRFPPVGLGHPGRDDRSGDPEAAHGSTQRQAAAKWKVDRPAVAHICRSPRQGRMPRTRPHRIARPGFSTRIYWGDKIRRVA